MTTFTVTQGRYLSFIHTYLTRHGCAPAESEIAAALCVSPPSVNQMVKMLERKGLISRQPGVPRSIRVLVAEDEIPSWRTGRIGDQGAAGRTASLAAGSRTWVAQAPSPASVYVLKIFLVNGPTEPKFAGKEISRVIEIRGDQTLRELHDAIFRAYDRWEQHAYEFQLGRRPFDPNGPTYSESPKERQPRSFGATTTTVDELGLKEGRAFGYWFDFGADWYHQIQVDKFEKAIPTVSYPRVTRRIGKSPPQYWPTEDFAELADGKRASRQAKRKRIPSH